MNICIKDANGSDLNIVRLSLTPDGFEIVVGDDIPQAFVDSALAARNAVANDLASQNAIGDAPSADSIAPNAESVFASTPEAPEAVAAAPAGVELDADGVPWDERIHSSSKKKTAKNVWAKRKNLPDGLHEQVTAQLKAGAPEPTPEPVSQDRPQPNTAAPDAPAAPGEDTVPDAPSAPEAPDAEAPLPEGNKVGDANDSGLASVLAQWGS